MAYAQALDYDAKWALAADVYATIVEHTDPRDDADIAVPAHIQLAYCFRTLGDFEASAAAYSEASRIALAAGDLIGVLRGRLGDAKLAIERGNMPQAEQILIETVEQAHATGLDDIRSRALHERAYLAGLRGNHDRAIKFAYDALELSPSQADRDRILTNIATGFRYLGLTDVARDAYLVLANTAQEQYVRWMAELNLMELAANDRIELEFDRYRRSLEPAEFMPLLRVTYLLHVGRGYHTLGNTELGIPYLEQAIDMAAKCGLNQLLFEAESALALAKSRKQSGHSQPPYVASSEIEEVVDAIQQMKRSAGIA
jgi:tetratricopeptide (TPR) repeat protein